MTGHNYRSYRFPKRTFRNQYLGPFLNHEMNRCIQCYRCVRFYREYAGGTDFNVFKLRDIAYFGRSQDGILENEFAGNLVEVCPTGVFTDRTLKQHYTRKWDLTMAPSVCVHCGLGCNTTIGERYGLLRRVINRYSGAVNGYFLCDRGRYGYEFVNSEKRIRAPMVRSNGAVTTPGREEILRQLQNLLAGNGSKVIGIGSPRASLEANFALRALVGPENFYAGISHSELQLVSLMLDILRQGPAPGPSMRETENSDAVLILGEDVTHTAPRLALSLRQSARQRPAQDAAKLRIPLWQDHAVRELVQEQYGPFFIAAPYATRLDEIATETYRAAPDDIARLGYAIAHQIDSSAPPPRDDLSPASRALTQRIVAALARANKPLIVSGAGCRSEAIIRAAANISRALCHVGRAASLCFTAPEANSVGMAMLADADLDSAFEKATHHGVDIAIILENDLYRRAPSEGVSAFFKSVRHSVAIDSLVNKTTEQAEIVLPAGTFAESDGTFVNNEGRVQRFFAVWPAEDGVQESWRWLAQMKPESSWRQLDDVITAMSQSIPALSSSVNAAPPSPFRMAGAKVPREPHRFSGRTSILANISVSEPKPPQDPDTPLSFTMEGSSEQPPSALIPFFWTPGWNSIQAVNKFQTEIAAALEGGDPGVRLIEPSGEKGEYFGGAPAEFHRRPGEWYVIPIHHIYGSEELSNFAPAVGELAPKPYLALNQADARELNVNPGDFVEVRMGGSSSRLAAEILPDLPAGLAGIPVGLAEAPVVNLPAWAKIAKGK